MVDVLMVRDEGEGSDWNTKVKGNGGRICPRCNVRPQRGQGSLCEECRRERSDERRRRHREEGDNLRQIPAQALAAGMEVWIESGWVTLREVEVRRQGSVVLRSVEGPVAYRWPLRPVVVRPA